jgi:hypothetical protein
MPRTWPFHRKTAAPNHSLHVRGKVKTLSSRAKQPDKQAKADLYASHEDFRPHASVEMTELPVDEQEPVRNPGWLLARMIAAPPEAKS